MMWVLCDLLALLTLIGKDFHALCLPGAWSRSDYDVTSEMAAGVASFSLDIRLDVSSAMASDWSE